MKLATSIISAFLTVGSTFKIPNIQNGPFVAQNGPSVSQNGPPAVRRRKMPRPSGPSLADMPFTRRTACPTAPLSRGLPIPGFEDKNWNLSDLFRHRMNKKIENFETGQCDTMLVRIEKNHVIDICFHYQWETGNPWSMETTCVSEKYREVDCYMAQSNPWAPLSLECQAKEEMPLFLSPSLMNTGLGELLFDFDPTELSDESSDESSDSYNIIRYDDPRHSRFHQDEIVQQWYYTDTNGNLKISDCNPSLPDCILDRTPSTDASSDDAKSGLRRKRETESKMLRKATHEKRARKL